MKNEFAENITDTSKLTRQKLGKNIKAKILTAQYQAVRILCGAPERAQTISLFLTDFQIFTNYLE